jgi:hypothetical protein
LKLTYPVFPNFKLFLVVQRFYFRVLTAVYDFTLSVHENAFSGFSVEAVLLIIHLVVGLFKYGYKLCGQLIHVTTLLMSVKHRPRVRRSPTWTGARVFRSADTDTHTQSGVDFLRMSVAARILLCYAHKTWNVILLGV